MKLKQSYKYFKNVYIKMQQQILKDQQLNHK